MDMEKKGNDYSEWLSYSNYLIVILLQGTDKIYHNSSPKSEGIYLGNVTRRQCEVILGHVVKVTTEATGRAPMLFPYHHLQLAPNIPHYLKNGENYGNVILAVVLYYNLLHWTSGKYYVK